MISNIYYTPEYEYDLYPLPAGGCGAGRVINQGGHL